MRRIQSCLLATGVTLCIVTFISFSTGNVSMQLIDSTLQTSNNNLKGVLELNNNKSHSRLPQSIWSQGLGSGQQLPIFAYVQYATRSEYFCNALINAKRLRTFQVLADVVILYPEDWSTKGSDTQEAKLLLHAKQKVPDIILEPVKLLNSQGDNTWRHSTTKFHAFRLTRYERILYFDSDSLVLNNMDHYFLAPKCHLAVPRAYWLAEPDQSLAQQVMGSHVMLIEPNEKYYQNITREAENTGEFDMEIINSLFKNSATILPHHSLALLSGEFRNHDHRRYLSEDPELDWNAHGEFSQAYLVHFSDWPLPKPWKSHTKAQWDAALPDCDPSDIEKDDRPACADRVTWVDLYGLYDMEKKAVCEGIQ